MTAQRARTASTPQHAPASLQFSLINIVLLVLGLLAVTIGFVLLARGSTVAAPLLLVLGYVVLIPLAIIR
jgi:hypothetical protein